MIYLVRHAEAGSRATWDGADRERPLTQEGLNQALKIAQRLAAEEITTILSSPYRRCVQTVFPLSASSGIPLAHTDALAEGSPPEHTQDLMRSVGDGSVLCSHGDVLGNLVGMLAAEGAPIDPNIAFRKGGMWRLDRTGTRITAAEYVTAPLA